MVGVKQPHISRIERGDDGPPLRVFKAIAEALNVSITDLVSDDRTAAELALVDAFRALPPARQQGWIDMARAVQAEASVYAGEERQIVGPTEK